MTECNFLGCTNLVDKSEWPWRMCDPCYFEASSWDDR